MRNSLPPPRIPVLVFKTSVETTRQLRLVQPSLDQLVAQGEKWNFDLEDVDHILRVESRVLTPDRVIETVRESGFLCEELED